MRAAVLSPRVGTDEVQVREWPEPDVPDGWVLVALRRAALNRLDAMTVADRAALPSRSVIGSDGAGVVRRLGRGVTGVRPGEDVVLSPSLWWGQDATAPGPDYEILGSPTAGTHAELVAVPAENVFAKPTRLTWDETAALPLAGLTAWRALVTRGRLTAGETVVVAASSSGVGSLAVSIAAALGAHVVAVSSSPEKLEWARFLGASEGVLRTSSDFAERLARRTGGAADLALDPTGALWGPLVGALRPGGRLVAVGRMAASRATLTVQAVYWKQVDVLGSSMGSPKDFAQLLAHVERASWRPLVDSVFPLQQIGAAYRRLDAPDRVGKVVLDTYG